jgi:YidC/Oxa1 family membrane protein insertase
MDKNSAIGFGLLIAILIGYFTYNNYTTKEYQKQVTADSIAKAPALEKAKAEAIVMDSLTKVKNDSLSQALPAAFRGEAKEIVIENEKIALTFNTHGGQLKKAQLKQFTTYHKKPLYLFDGADNGFNMLLAAGNEQVAAADLYFTPTLNTTGDGAQSLELKADLGNGKQVVYSYLLPKDEYMFQLNIRIAGMPSNTQSLTWNLTGLSTEKDVNNERMATQIYYRFKDNDDDYFTVNEEKTKKLDQPVSWLGYRQQYFSTALIAEGAFNTANIHSNTKIDDKNLVSKSQFTFDLPVKAGGEQQYNFKWFIGPNDYNTLKAYNLNLDDMVPYGYGLFTFVKYINKWFLLPLFTFLSSTVGHLAMVLVLMTVIIRLLLSFFTYKSFLSSAKMRVLKPELDELREQCGDDKQKYGMEQMKLFKTAGVNPLGGCLPMLLQLPILLSLYYFIPTVIDFRQYSYLWADDLSTYDSIFSWSTQIPILSSIYGNHVSLFTLLMTASSLFLAIYNKNNTPQDPNNPMMKWMPFIFPFFLMGFFNKMAAALTFYYFVSNMLSIVQQYIIQKFFIDEKKVHAQIQENKNKPAGTSKWAEKIAEIQKQQQAAQNRKK